MADAGSRPPTPPRRRPAPIRRAAAPPQTVDDLSYFDRLERPPTSRRSDLKPVADTPRAGAGEADRERRPPPRATRRRRPRSRLRASAGTRGRVEAGSRRAAEPAGAGYAVQVAALNVARAKPKRSPSG